MDVGRADRLPARAVHCPPCEAWITNADGSATRSLELGPGSELTPVPAPNGTKIAFASNRGDGIWRLYVGKLDGGPVKQVTDPGPVVFGDFQPRWSPHGNDLVFGRDVNGVDNDLFTVHGDGSDLHQVTTRQAGSRRMPTGRRTAIG